jgi:uncharacterized protein YbaR (Trm112 family)
MDKKLLDIACCPLTKLPLELLDADRGEPVPPTDQLREALVTRDGRLVYPVRDGIPILLVEESIDWSRLPAGATG